MEEIVFSADSSEIELDAVCGQSIVSTLSQIDERRVDDGAPMLAVGMSVTPPYLLESDFGELEAGYIKTDYAAAALRLLGKVEGGYGDILRNSQASFLDFQH